MQFNYSTPVKQCDSNSKPSKSHNQTRQGDWICLNCNNLNFSFRKKCNRCKTQTRKQNQDLQNAYTLYFYNQQQANLYNYEHQQLYHQSMNEPMYYVSDAKSQNENICNHNESTQHPLAFSRNNQNNQVIQAILTSPFKELLENSDMKVEEKINKKLRTPSSKKRKTLRKMNDMLPSVSPLLKKLLAKQDTNSKINISSTKDPLNVALFYDQMWDSNKQNCQKENQQCSVLDGKNHIYLSNSGKKIMGNSRMHKTNDSTNNAFMEDDGFAFLMRSPQKDYDDEVIQIDEGDEQLANIINRIII